MTGQQSYLNCLLLVDGGSLHILVPFLYPVHPSADFLRPCSYFYTEIFPALDLLISKIFRFRLAPSLLLIRYFLIYHRFFLSRLCFS